LSKIVVSGDGQTLIHSSSIYINTVVNLYNLNIRSISASPVIAIYGNMMAANSLTLIDLETERSFQPLAQPGMHTSTGIPRDIAFSPDGSLIVTVGSSGMLNFWGIEPRASE
jgi:WD40 repeat protein